jgi:hypothetical protein
MINVTTRPIHFNSNVAAVVKRLESLGLTRVAGNPHDTWQVFSAPSGGRIGIHQVEVGSELDGVSRLGFEVPDETALTDLAASFADSPGAATAELVDTTHGKAIKVKTIDGLKFLIDIVDDNIGNNTAALKTPNPELSPGVEIAQMWFTDNAAAARELLIHLGATELVTANDYDWDDCRLPGGGRTQLHSTNGTARVSLGFMSAVPLEQLKHQVDLAGDDGSIVDETWGRYLDLAPVTVTKPETGLDGELTWVNEEMKDYYCYQVHQNPAAE